MANLERAELVLDNPDDKAPEQPLYPSHGWGKLAENPRLELGSYTEEYREVLRRIWRRQGGDDAWFDVLLPPVKDKQSQKRS